METLLLAIARLLRSAPNVKGKFRLGMSLETLLLGKQGWSTTSVQVQMKNGNLMDIDPRSAMHKGPLYCGVYDDQIISKFCAVFNRDWIVLDVGASIGYWLIPFLRSLGPSKVIGFEPLPSNYEKLKENLRLNDLTAVVHNFALGDKEGTAIIHATEKGNTGNAYINDVPIAGIPHHFQNVIPIRTLDSLIDQFDRCDFIKMDIEGAEIFAIKGGLTFLKEFHPIIFGEFNSLFLDNSGYTIVDIGELLEPLGYVPFANNMGSFKRVELKYKMQDILFVPKHRINEVKGLVE